MRNHLALIPTWRYYNLFTIRPEALNQSASWFRLQDPSPLLDYLHQHKCTIESGRGCWRCPQEGSFLDNCTITYPFRRPVFIFVSCSLILPEQHIVISAWRARWIALFLISHPSPLLCTTLFISHLLWTNQEAYRFVIQPTLISSFDLVITTSFPISLPI